MSVIHVETLDVEDFSFDDGQEWQMTPHSRMLWHARDVMHEKGGDEVHLIARPGGKLFELTVTKSENQNAPTCKSK